MSNISRSHDKARNTLYTRIDGELCVLLFFTLLCFNKFRLKKYVHQNTSLATCNGCFSFRFFLYKIHASTNRVENSNTRILIRNKFVFRSEIEHSSFVFVRYKRRCTCSTLSVQVICYMSTVDFPSTTYPLKTTLFSISSPHLRSQRSCDFLLWTSLYATNATFRSFQGKSVLSVYLKTLFLTKHV